MSDKSLCACILPWGASIALGMAASCAIGMDQVTQNLPELHERVEPQPGYFNLGERNATLGFRSRGEKWDATLNDPAGADPALSIDYGRLLSSRFGAGASVTRQGDYSEVLLNGIYAPKRNLRLRLAGAQLRTGGLAPDSLGSGADPLLQNSYLFGVRKYWTKYAHLSDLGISAYVVDAEAAESGGITSQDDTETLEADGMASSTLAVGRMQGYMLNLGLRPTPQSRLELRREISQLTYAAVPHAQRDEASFSSRVSYAQYFDNCLRFQSGYSMAPDAERLDLKLARHSWNVRLSHAQDGSNSDTAIRVGYTIALGRSPHRRADCEGNLNNAPAFEPIVDAAVARPQQFPRQPLAVIEGP